MGSKRKVKCVETNAIYNSVVEAAKAIGLKETSGIRACCGGKYNTSGGYHWEYYEDSDLPGEVWKYARYFSNNILHDFDDKYKCSNMGRIKRSDNNHILTGSHDDQGYLQTNLDGKKRRVHRVIATTFIHNDNPESKIEINHKDENKENNAVSNLEWVTPKENANHGSRTIRSSEGHYKKVRCIETGIVYDSIKDAANAVKCKSGSGISACCMGKSKTSGGYHWEYVTEE